MNLKEHAAQETRRGCSSRQTGHRTETGQPQSLATHETTHGCRGRAKRQQQGDFTISLDVRRHHGVEANRGKQEGGG